jgi:hypothetical protein
MTIFQQQKKNMGRESSEHPTLERTISNSICNELSDDDPFENLLMPRSSDQPTSSHTQTTSVCEEIEAFFKVKFIFLRLGTYFSNIGGSLSISRRPP